MIALLLAACTLISDGEVTEKLGVPDEAGDSGGLDSGGSDSSGDTAVDTADETGNDTALSDVDGDGFTESDGDCNDANLDVHPGAPEMCDGVDQDCDGLDDDDDPDVVGTSTWYPDLDGDGYGNANYGQVACAGPAGYVADATDCYDGDPDIHPGAEEVCNGLDDDCDGGIDVGATDALAYYADLDGDTFGDPATGVHVCSRPDGWVEDDADCDDGDPALSPAADEICNGFDDNCDGLSDDDDPTIVGAPAWYADADGDGFGDVFAAVASCAEPLGYVADALDCDDLDAATNPAGTETCNGVDDDCDGTTDSAALDASTYYLDADVDGYGDIAATANGCSAPPGYVSDYTDCYDANSSAYPGQTTYFTYNRGDGSFDWDCDGTESQEYTECWDGSSNQCPALPLGGPGWWDGVTVTTVAPACGVTECWLGDCDDLWRGCATTNTQSCR